MASAIRVPKELRDKILKISCTVDPNSGRFVCSLMQDYIRQIQSNRSEWIPRNSQQLASVNWEALSGIDGHISRWQPTLLDFQNHSRGRRRTFKPSKQFLECVVDEIDCAYELANPSKFVELVSGKPIRSKRVSKGKYESGTSYPALISNSLRAISSRPFNRSSILAHLVALKVKEGISQRYLNDMFCWLQVLSQKPVHLAGDIWSYRSAYKAQSTGRVGEIGGGLQSCTREMKYASALGADIKNYDLKSSQIVILRQLLASADISYAWLDRYLSASKEQYASGVGISKDCWKEMLMAFIYGAGRDKLISIVTTAGFSLAEFDRFESTVCDLKSSLRKLNLYLKGVYLDEYGFKYKGKRGLKNKTGSKRYIDELKGAQLLAFILQGFEASFIHYITVHSIDYDFDVVGNEHDGLITVGKIPQVVIDKASKDSTVFDSELIIRSFI